MWTSVPQTPAHRTRMSTSSSRIFGSGTFFSLKPGPAVSFTSAFTRDSSCVGSVDGPQGVRRAGVSCYDWGYDASQRQRRQTSEYRRQNSDEPRTSWLPVVVSEI